MGQSQGNDNLIRSAEARKMIKVGTCDLAHLRQDGKIRYTKEGNSYLYSLVDLKKLAGSSDSS
jgi:hypothetical protein